ncbi:MAG: hydrogenase iron-sulfur subunit [Candidatus Bathyarchaeota archaeon]|nr:hydrogenase iron-sulfur subunit [Candidatus Bathyarchaeota archaeon]MCX8176857.1 hydrogenase iron-sulfur subunit [Candidatus Bathyarchaeota archaeon]MDW8193459.1 hydrogenase iron-sulfur subunit [Nitrososphaerota archaeon]
MTQTPPQTQSWEKPGELRIGVFICHCGLNIAGVIDIKELVEFAKTLPDVVYVKDNRYTCADPGQDEIRKAIKEYKLNRVVVAACSPRMHEVTFRRTVSDAGLNPYLFEMANIREFSSWCHPSTPKEATEKAKDLIKMAVAKARLLIPLQTIEVPVTNKALVIGGGIAGINAALDLAEMGFKVYLLEKSESIGGHMAQLDKTFPTLDCSICIEGPKMVDVGRHPNIEIISYADLISVSGYIGNFRVKIRKNPRYVKAENCTGCGECKDVCPIEYPNDWDMDLGVRKAISVPFDQAVPLLYTINKDYCIECFKCVDACGERRAIDFEQKPEDIELEVGAIIVATGYDIYLPYDNSLYGYGKYTNVITSLEFERLILAAGPTGGKVLRASDGKKPHSVAFIQCVGSRDINKYPYCSNFCCMYTLKHVVQLKEKYKDDVEVYVFYMDMRTNFKGFEEFYQRARELGVNFIRGRVSRITEIPGTKNLVIHAEDANLGMPIEIEAEMVVLATAAIPKKGADEVARILNLTRGADGFFMESHPKLKPLDSPTDGIFLAGACQGPKDIPYSVSQGCGAAARAATILSKQKWKIEPIIAVVDPVKCRNVTVKCGICAERCPYGAIKVAEKQPAQVITAMCHGCGTCVAECPADAIQQMHFTDAQILAQLRAALEKDPEDKILAFLCNWCSYAGADLAGTSRFEYPPVIRPIRVMCSGRVDRDFVLEAFRLGAGMVLVAACHLPYDCHYISGNWKMKARMEALAPMLHKLGLSPERFRVEYISAAEGIKFAELIKEMAEQMQALGRERIKAENEKLRPVLENMLKRKEKR